MKARAHAILSASGSERWLTCTPSARLEADFPEESSSYADEGTLAHSLAELHLRKFLGRVEDRVFKAAADKLAKNQLYAHEMVDHVETYISVASERISAAKARSKDAIVLLEQRLDFSPWVPEGFGTGDCVIVADKVLEIIDFKYGKGVPVSAIENTQMRLYALGALYSYGMIYDIDKVFMTICQPRLDSVSTDEITAADLYLWGDEYVKPRAELATAGKGVFVSGDHCRFCRARNTCRARAEANLALAKYDFAKPELLSHDDVAAILGKAEELQKWAADVQGYALDQAENHGVKFPGWKLVEGRSNRKYSDADAVAKALLAAGYPETLIYEKSILGITAMEKAIGKKAINELPEGLIVKPPGKPVLVPESDKRPEISSTASAQQDFAESAN